MIKRTLLGLSLMALASCETSSDTTSARSAQALDQALDQALSSDGGPVGGATSDLDFMDLGAPDATPPSSDPPAPSVWSQPLFLGTEAIDQALGIGCSPRHELVIAGRTEGALSQETSLGFADGFVALISDSGELEWLKQLGSDGVDQLLDVVYHPEELIIAGGFSTGDFGAQVNQQFMSGVLVALQPNGELLWQRLLEFGTVNRLLATSTGVVVVGSTELEGGDYAAFIAEYDLSGERRWSQLINSPAFDSATSATLANDTLYVSGFTSGSITAQRSHEHTDMFIAALSLTGETLWVKEYGTEAEDSPVRIAHDDEGLIIAGYTSGRLGERSFGSNDVAVLKLDFNGELLWGTQWGTEGSEAAYALVITADERIILSGRIDDGTWDERPNMNGDAFIMELSPQGQQLGVWQHRSAGRDELVDLCLTQDQLNVAGYVGGLGEDLDIVIDRFTSLGEPRDYASRAQP